MQGCKVILLYLIEKLSILLFYQSLTFLILTLAKLLYLPRIQISLTVFAAIPPYSPRELDLASNRYGLLLAHNGFL